MHARMHTRTHAHTHTHTHTHAHTHMHTRMHAQTKLRNRLSVPHLEDLMQVALNSPKPTSAAYEAFLEEVYAHWFAAVKRNVNKSHPGVSRARKAKRRRTLSLFELAEEDFDADEDELPFWLRDEHVEDGVYSESDDVPLSQRFSTKKGATTGLPSTNSGLHELPASAAVDPSIADLQAAHGEFIPSDAWEIAPKPAQADQLRLDKSVVWSMHRIGHVFDDGWAEGLFRGKWGGRLENRNKYIVSYPKEGRYAHELNLSEYGADKVWVILRKKKAH